MIWVQDQSDNQVVRPFQIQSRVDRDSVACGAHVAGLDPGATSVDLGDCDAASNVINLKPTRFWPRVIAGLFLILTK